MKDATATPTKVAAMAKKRILSDEIELVGNVGRRR